MSNIDNNHNASSEEEWKPNNRPQSVIALEFSAALDDLFKLNGVGALEESVEHKKDEVHFQQYELEDLDARLRETSERLRRLQATSPRSPRHPQIQQQRQPVSAQYNTGESTTDDDSSGDSDEQGHSPQGERNSR
ncbi:hypothetical protein PV10_00992 [Exophiala mesophila]|uniref:Uncharacterized protein n=1 Tax=Exophiala mesophila TaxID=212818 RepID=A0A0D1Y946_EXOME|nr:uncharacterized protein PV10_00992 [Exophiala mesophila]KIV97216.1 hypothetical protein PV10_00992 [Exophiala mesophila]